MSAARSRGSKRERQVRDWLLERDWVVIHTRPGTNFCDVVALKLGKRPMFVEVKSTAGGPWEHFRAQDRLDLIAVAALAGADAYLAWWPPRGQLRWFHSSEWPNRHLEVVA
jgi:Holliday junction resolvase